MTSLNLSIENVVDSENGYWCEMTLEPAKKPAPTKKERSPLKEKNDQNTFERVKSAGKKRSSLLDEKVMKNKEHNEKAKSICQERQEMHKQKLETITTVLNEKINRASKIKEENLSKIKRKNEEEKREFELKKKEIHDREVEEKKRIEEETKEKLRKAEEIREENKRKIKLNNELKEKKFLNNKEKNIKNTIVN